MRSGVQSLGAAGRSACATLLAACILHAQVVFTDVTAKAGIHFVHNAGRTGKKYLPETLGNRQALASTVTGDQPAVGELQCE